MVQAQLPNELLVSIADILHDDLDASERRQMGRNLSLVCKQFVALGRRILWRRKTISFMDPNYVAAYELAKRPDILAYVRQLRFEGDVVPADVMVAMASGCSGSLKVFECLPAILRPDDEFVVMACRDDLHGLASSTMAPSLEILSIGVALGPDLAIGDLASPLSMFQSLDELRLSIHFGRSPAVGIQVVEGHKLVSLHLDAETSAKAPDCQCHLCRAFPVFVQAIANLPHLELVRLGHERSNVSSNPQALHRAPLHLEDVLAALPPAIVTYHVEGLYFLEPPGLTNAASQRTSDMRTASVKVWMQCDYKPAAVWGIVVARRTWPSGAASWEVSEAQLVQS
ncbi:hypothetical protein JCM8208_004214 [Rhodotorula glutinis]